MSDVVWKIIVLELGLYAPAEALVGSIRHSTFVAVEVSPT